MMSDIPRSAHRRAATLVLCSICLSLSLPAQEAEPEEPGIVLPPTLLEVEDLQVEEISAVIPEEDVQLLPEIEIPLPQAEEIFLPEERFDIPYPDQLTDIPGGATRSQRPANIFSEGEIAVGSMTHVRGDLTLYRLGPDPRFDLRFYHDKIDGYGLRSAGSGYYHSDDLLEGNISYASGKFDINANAGVVESSDGLQRVGEYESLTHRKVHGEGAVAYSPSEKLAFTGSIGAGYAQQILSSVTPLIDNEFTFDTRIGLDWNTKYVDLMPTIGYLLLNRQNLTHTFDIDLSAILKVNEVLRFDLAAGATWLEIDEFHFPFYAAGIWQPSDMFSLEAGGGYFLEYPTFDELYTDYTFADASGSLTAERGWYSYADTQVRLLQGLFVAAEVDYRYFDEVNGFGAEYSETTGLFPLVKQQDVMRLQSGVGLRYNIDREFNFTMGWDGQFLGSHPFEASHALYAGFSYRQPEDIFGVGLDVSMPLVQWYTYIPEVQLTAFYRLTKSVRIYMYVSDPLSPLIREGRVFWEPYEASGFHVYLGTNISL